MKKLLLISLLILIPLKVSAGAATFSLSCPSLVSANQEVNCTLSSSVSSGTLAGLTADYNFGSNVTFSSATAGSSWNIPVSSSTILNTYNSAGSSGSFTVATIKIRIGAVSPNTSVTFGLTITKAYDIDSAKVDLGNSVVSQTMRTASSNNNLSALSVSNGSLTPEFNPGVTTYSVTTTNSSLTINASLADSKSSFVSGYGPRTVTVNYGTSAFQIKVKAENQAIKIYTINITRNDSRSSINTLSSLTVTNTKISFNNNTTTYYQTVENNISSVTINATTTDSKAKLSGTGTKTLNEGVNTFKVIVTAENNSSKTYTINITRKNINGGTTALSSNNYLSSVTIDKVTMFFSKEMTVYNLTVGNNIDEVKINYTTEDSKAVAKLLDSTTLKEGKNEIKISVTSENGKNRIYYFYITRSSLVKEVKNDKTSIINALKEVDFVTVKLTNEMKPYIDQDIISNIVLNNKIINYKFIENDQSIYQINLSRTSVPSSTSNSYLISKEVKENEAIINLNTPAHVVYLNLDNTTNLEYEIDVTKDYSEGTKLYLYQNDLENKQINLLNGNIIVKNNLAKLSVGEYKNYLLSDQLLTNNNDNKITKVNNLSIVVIAESIIIVAAVVAGIIIIKKVKKAQ